MLFYLFLFNTSTIYYIYYIYIGIQALLDEPNEGDPAQLEPYKLYKDNREEYRKRVRQQAAEMTPRD